MVATKSDSLQRNTILWNLSIEIIVLQLPHFMVPLIGYYMGNLNWKEEECTCSDTFCPDGHLARSSVGHHIDIVSRSRHESIQGDRLRGRWRLLHDAIRACVRDHVDEVSWYCCPGQGRRVLGDRVDCHCRLQVCVMVRKRQWNDQNVSLTVWIFFQNPKELGYLDLDQRCRKLLFTLTIMHSNTPKVYQVNLCMICICICIEFICWNHNEKKHSTE